MGGGGGRKGPALLTGRFCFLWGGGGVLLCSQVGSAFCEGGGEEGSCFAHR